jgi:hypothetical protein
MTMRCKKLLYNLVIVGGLVMTATFPAAAQQDQQQTPMMDQGRMDQGGKMMGRGGMMGDPMDAQNMGDLGDCPMMGAGRRGSMKEMGHRMMMHSGPMMEARLAYIKADLAITEAQTAAWDGYADAVRARRSTTETKREEMMKAKEGGSALQRMDARIKAMEAKLDGLKVLKAPTEALYAVLSDEQKKKADELLGGRCGMM